MKFSLNNRLILQEYVKDGLKSKVMNGIATPGQRDGLKGLTVLLDAYLSDGRHIPKGSVAYIKEETLWSHGWASKSLSSDLLPVRFLIVESTFVEAFDIPDVVQVFGQADTQIKY